MFKYLPLDHSETQKKNMSFLSSMENRYTTKKYNPNKKISIENIDELKQVLRLSPSSINSQPWKFTFVSDSETKERLSTVSWHNTNKVLDCDTVVIFSRINDTSLFESQIKRELPEGAVNYYMEFIKPQAEGKSNLGSTSKSIWLWEYFSAHVLKWVLMPRPWKG